MNLKDLLVSEIEKLGLIHFTNSFGWICFYLDKNMFGGYKAIDDNILMLFLILSPQGFKSSLDEGFVKFEFGQTWSEAEIINASDVTNTLPFIQDAFDYAKIRRNKKLKLK